ASAPVAAAVAVAGSAVAAAVVAAAVVAGNAGNRLAILESSTNRAPVDSLEPAGARGAPGGGPKQYPYSWLNCTFLLVVHLTALVGGGLYAWKHGFSVGIVVLTAIWTFVTILSLS